MADDRPWYREPETFIAVAALVVSVSAVVVGLYEASLQRRHDRAEVWPHLEISTFTTLQGVALRLDNTGIGPAQVKSITVTVDGKSQHSWDEPLTTLYGHEPPPHSDLTVTEHALRAGDQLTVVGIGTKDLPPNFWKWIGRVSVSICYTSVRRGMARQRRLPRRQQQMGKRRELPGPAEGLRPLKRDALA